MIAISNVLGKWSENKMEGEDVWTVECLRGRLLAERMASKAAKEKEEQMANKLMELENKLRIEIRSRNKAEKRKKLLMKKLGSLNISFDSYESDYSFENSEVSSFSSSTASSYTKQEDMKPNIEIKLCKMPHRRANEHQCALY